MSDLNLGVIGNCAYSALIDPQGRIVWCCLPRFDGDPVFADLLNDGAATSLRRGGRFEIVLDGLSRCEQRYLDNTAVLVTRLASADGSALEITDFAPRFMLHGRQYRPLMIVRRIRPLAGRPRITLRLRPVFGYGASEPVVTRGSNHARYVGPQDTLRLTTNASVSYVIGETPFLLEEPLTLLLGPDESVPESPLELGERFFDKTVEYWREWVRTLAVPLDYQKQVVRAAITLKLCSYEETGAIIAAMTTSIPEAPNTGRNWDYRYCWLRDAFFVVHALNRLGSVGIMENYLRYLRNIVANSRDGHLQPVFGIGLEEHLIERQEEALAGYRGMGPVRVGNQAHEHHQHDVYGDVILATTQAFFDERLLRPAGEADFYQLEAVGEQAFRLHDQPDAGMWELRTMAKIHTSSSLMCWAACDRLAKIAAHLGLSARAGYWAERAQLIHARICERAWNAERNSFVDAFDGENLDASLLLMAEVNFLPPHDPRFVGTVEAIGRELLRGRHMFRYAAADDFGTPETAFNICTFWYIQALAAIGRRDEARVIFEEVLARCNHIGLLSEDLDPVTGELWGNYPQTYSLVGMIYCAMRLSRRWEDVL